MTHIGKKLGEVMPAFTDGYTASAIAFVVLMVDLVAAGVHSFPKDMKASIGQTVGTPFCPSNFYSEASTTGCISPLQIASISNFRISTIAEAFPRDAFTDVGGWFVEDDKPSESFSDKALDSCAGGRYDTVRHGLDPFKVDGRVSRQPVTARLAFLFCSTIPGVCQDQIQKGRWYG